MTFGHAQLLSIIDSAMDAILTVDERQCVVLYNRAAERIFGVPVSDALGSPLERFIPDRFRGAHAGHVRAFTRTGTTSRRMGRLGALTGLRADGSEFPIEASISQSSFEGRQINTVILRDVSERQQLEAQFLQAQKMEGIGRLAGGIAHDFNNLLMAMFNYLTLASRRLEPGHPAHASLTCVQEAAQRASSLTRQLLTFSRKQTVAPRVISIRDVVVALEPTLRGLLGDALTIKTRLPPRIGPVLADVSQIEQVIVNLVVNARDAMPEGGTMTLECADVTLDEEYCRLHIDATPGRHVMLSVTDTGIGMDSSVLEHLFEPFFTTKPAGQGTGLGLATCHGIVKQYGGHIAVVSSPGVGTSVRVFLARLPDPSDEAPAPRPDADAAPAPSAHLTE